MPDGQQVPVRDGLVIGRVAGCDVVVDDTKASRRHARLCVAAGVVEIEDLGSSNGTLLNGKPVQRRMLRNGDEVTIGNTVLVYRDAAAGAGAAPSVGAEDDVDLFGGDAPAAPAAAAPSPRSSPPAAAPPPPSGVVEFADEVVEVRKTSVTARPAAPAAGGASAAGVIQQKQRTLQFHQNVERGGALGDDLGQLGGGARTLIYVAVLAGAVGVAWAIIVFMS